MGVLFFTFAVMLSLSNAQYYVENDNDNNEMNNYGNVSNCIGKYRDLEKYVLSNEDLMDNLTGAYFKAGKPFTEFVRITYKFKVLLPVTNSTNDKISHAGNDDGQFICVDSQTKFIWSSSALYLLGPEPLFWLTLFAVNVQESSVTIQLPCLCSDAYDNLLTRLTYLIKVYPAMQFQSQTIQFISTYFFETKAPAEHNYKAIVSILSGSSVLPCATFLVFSYLVYFYSEWIVRLVKKYIADGEEKVRKKRLRLRDRRNHECTPLLGSTDDRGDQLHEEEKEKQIRRIKIAALILVSICLSITLFVFHIIASVRLIQYGNEVLNDAKVQFKFSMHRGKDDESDQGIPIIYIVFSFLPVICFIIIIIRYCCCGSASQSGDEALGKHLQVSLGVLLIYLGFCFSLYMVLAFINDPIATGFVYLIGASCIFCIYLLIVSYTFSFFFILRFMLSCSRYKLSCLDMVYVIFTLASGISVAYFLSILIFILTLGNFHDLQAVQNLTLPIIIGLLSFFVFKPFLKSIKNSVKIDTTEHDTDHNNATTENPEANVNNADNDHTNETAV